MPPSGCKNCIKCLDFGIVAMVGDNFLCVATNRLELRIAPASMASSRIIVVYPSALLA
jgi:hypothetical protein